MAEPNSRRSFWLLVRLGVLILVVGISALALVYITFLSAWQRSEVTPHTYAVALADLDGDGDLDAFYANGLHEGPEPNTVLLHQAGAQGGAVGSVSRFGPAPGP